MKKHIILGMMLFIMLFVLSGCSARTMPDGGEKGGDGSVEEDEEEGVEKDVEAVSAVSNAALSIREERLYIPGLDREYRFLFLTDTHLIVLSGEETEQEQQNAQTRLTQIFFNVAGQPASEQFSSFIAYANEKEVDGVLLGGDIIDFPSKANVEFLEKQLEALEVPWLYVLGNHDWTYPWEYMTPKAKEEYLPRLSGLTEGKPAARTLEFDSLVILGVDDSSNQVNAEALETVKTVMKGEKPVIVMQHVPFAEINLIREAKNKWKNPVLLGHGIEGGIWPDENSQQYMSLLFNGDKKVSAVLAGHIHMADTTKLMEGPMQFIGGAGYLGEAILLTVTGKSL